MITIKLKQTILAGFISIIFLSISCYEDPERDNYYDPANWDIVYPANGYYGENILSGDSLIAELNKSYSLRADITGYYSVRLTIPESINLNLSPLSIDWRVLTNDQWDYILFLADGPGVFDCDFRISGSAVFNGEINIYENDAETPAKKINISWE